jgi:hypothetical protein
MDKNIENKNLNAVAKKYFRSGKSFDALASL